MKKLWFILGILVGFLYHMNRVEEDESPSIAKTYPLNKESREPATDDSTDSLQPAPQPAK